MSTLTLNTPVNHIPLIGPVYVKRLEKLNLYTIHNLLHHYPARYLDLSKISPLNSLRIGDTVTVQGQIASCKNVLTKNNKRIQIAVIQNDTGSIQAIWFNQTYLPQTLKSGLTVNLSGTVKFFNRQLSLTSPDFEIINNHSKKPIHTARLVPIYPETKGLSSKWLRSRLNYLLSNPSLDLKKDWLPKNLKVKHQLINLNKALKQIHFPETKTSLRQAKKRLSFDEMFLLQLNALIRKKDFQRKRLSHKFVIDQEKLLAFISSLPFTLTKAQNKVSKEIVTDLSKNIPMNRLLQGDVGSGKTVIATLAMYLSYLNNRQSILMAPTEILAQQHFNTLKTVFSKSALKLNLVTGSTKKNLNSKTDIYIGTHALLFRKLETKNLGLVVIDEQHRFGVKQRSKLLEMTQSTTFPHLLTMTATPIPRTVALTAYADLSLSVLDELPPGRKPVKTWLVPHFKRQNAYNWIKKQITKHQSQAFIICPLIDPSQSQSMANIKTVTQEFDHLTQIFPDLKLKLLHGKIKSDKKQSILNSFKKNQTHILVSTPVIEVGIDIQNADIILIEAAERFGLAQLHQLRGRVGRGNQESYCLLFTSQDNPDYSKRLKALETTKNGMELAQLDLKLRGPGDLYGLAQHGYLDLKLASFTDLKLINSTKLAAQSIIQKPLPLALRHLLKKRKISLVKPN